MTISPVNPQILTQNVRNSVCLKDILKTLPQECFEQDRRKAWSRALINVLMVGLGYVGIAFAPWFLLPCCGFLPVLLLPVFL